LSLWNRNNTLSDAASPDHEAEQQTLTGHTDVADAAGHLGGAGTSSRSFLLAAKCRQNVLVLGSLAIIGLVVSGAAQLGNDSLDARVAQAGEISRLGGRRGVLQCIESGDKQIENVRQPQIVNNDTGGSSTYLGKQRTPPTWKQAMSTAQTKQKNKRRSFSQLKRYDGPVYLHSGGTRTVGQVTS